MSIDGTVQSRCRTPSLQRRPGIRERRPRIVDFLFQRLVGLEQLVNLRIACLQLPLEALNLALELLDVVLGPRPDGSLRLPVVGALAGELFWRKVGDASCACEPMDVLLVATLPKGGNVMPRRSRLTTLPRRPRRASPFLRWVGHRRRL
jgi:hypothetical protein